MAPGRRRTWRCSPSRRRLTDSIAEQIGDMVGFAAADAGDGLARPLPLPPGGRSGRRRVLAEAGPKRGHRRGAAPRPRAWAGHRPAGPAALSERRRSTSARIRAWSRPRLRSSAQSSTAGSAQVAEPVAQVLPNGGPLVVRHRVPGRVPSRRRHGRACACGRCPRTGPAAPRAPHASARSARRS